MGEFRITQTPLKDVVLIEPRLFGDSRGYFMESYNLRDLQELGIDETFVQDNQSLSGKAVLRGLHFQIQKPQGKLVRVISGEVFDVAVDLRKSSPTFKQWHGVILSKENNLQVYVPPGFAHGFLVLSESAEFIYKCTDYYDPNDEGGIIWNDAEIGIDWPLDKVGGRDGILLSEKDKSLKSMQETNVFYE